MGYNRRALNLQRAAATIVARHAGAVPGTLEELLALPGVGPYTARAVLAIAFGRPVAAVDTNVRRVVRRLVGAAGDGGGVSDARRTQGWADALVDPADPGSWTHAVMDLGATVCRRRAPRCGECPLVSWCRGAFPTTPPASRAGPRAAAPDRFPATRRWLRGRIVQRLRDRADGEWHVIAAPLGEHDETAVRAAIADLARDGIVEVSPDGAVRLPSAS
jgi:A/G-specific adenine glycosylase